MADIEILRYLATKTGLGLNYLSKDEKISIILEQQRDLFPEVVLKGGTALSRVYLAKKGVSRFSEDIDLDFISDKGLNEKIKRGEEKCLLYWKFNQPFHTQKPETRLEGLY